MDRLTATNRLNDGGRLLVENPQAADLDVPLTNSIIPQRGVGAVSFTRATTAKVTDHEWVIRNCLSGEARFQWARRVQNLHTYSEDITNAVWNHVSCTRTKNAWIAPDGTITAWLVTSNAATALTEFNQNYSIVSGQTYILSVSLKANGWLQYIQLVWNSATFWAGYINVDLSNGTITANVPWPANMQATVTPEANWFYRIQLKATAISTLANNHLSVAMIPSGTSIRVATFPWDGIKWFYYWHPQFEDVTGQSIQTAAEYVSTNVLTTAPFHGANVDGVKYFKTTITWLPISPSILKWILMEPSRTNRLLRSEDFGTTWTVIGATRAVNTAVAPSWELTGDNFIPNNGTQLSTMTQSVTTTASQYSFSVYVKSSGRQFVQLNAHATISSGYVNFDIINGIVGTSSIWTGHIENAGNGWWRCTATTESAVLVATQTFNIYPSNTLSDTRWPTAIGDWVNGLYLWWAQLEIWATATSYIPTVWSTVTRNVDALNYDVWNIIDLKWAVYCEVGVNLPWYTNLSWFIIDRWANGRYIYANNSVTALYNYDWTNILSSNIGASYNGSVVKVATSWNGSTKSIYYGSTVPKTWPYVGTFWTWNINIWYSWNGTIRNVRIWKEPPTVAELTSITTL